jgi:SAM-dependent methyltransferase
MARWLLDEPGLEYIGIDIDSELIDWCRGNLPANFVLGPSLPPTSLQNRTFDLIVSHSVFSHLDEGYQDKWLVELQRLIQPGGLLVISVHGPTAFKAIREQVDRDTQTAWRVQLESQGILFVRKSDWPQFPDFYQTTCHAPWYVMQRWQKWFELLAYIPHNDLEFQDVFVLRRRSEGEPRLPVIAHKAPLTRTMRAKRFIRVRAAALRNSRGTSTTSVQLPPTNSRWRHDDFPRKTAVESH